MWGAVGAAAHGKEAATMDTAPRYQVIVRVPTYDGRDAICGARHHGTDLVYGTIAGAIVGANLQESLSHGEVEAYIYDLVERRRVSRSERHAAYVRALGMNPAPRYYRNDNGNGDVIPF
jgi:hypothetical protein